MIRSTGDTNRKHISQGLVMDSSHERARAGIYAQMVQPYNGDSCAQDVLRNNEQGGRIPGSAPRF